VAVDELGDRDQRAGDEGGRVVDCHPDAGCCRPWGEPGAYHLVLAHIRRLPAPIPARGQRGLWDATGLVEDAGLHTLPAEINGGHTSGISDVRHQTASEEQGTAGPSAGSIPAEEGGASMTATCHTPHPGDADTGRRERRLTAAVGIAPARRREVTE
jgi:hypothetical protein